MSIVGFVSKRTLIRRMWGVSLWTYLMCLSTATPSPPVPATTSPSEFSSDTQLGCLSELPVQLVVGLHLSFPGLRANLASFQCLLVKHEHGHDILQRSNVILLTVPHLGTITPPLQGVKVDVSHKVVWIGRHIEIECILAPCRAGLAVKRAASLQPIDLARSAPERDIKARGPFQLFQLFACWPCCATGGWWFWLSCRCRGYVFNIFVIKAAF